jgi:hypothetical protein
MQRRARTTPQRIFFSYAEQPVYRFDPDALLNIASLKSKPPKSVKTDVRRR